MRKLLMTAAALAAFCTPAFADKDADIGVAYTLFYAAKCEGGNELVSEKLKSFIVLYVKARNGAVQAEQKRIEAQMSSMGVDYDTAVQLWCGMFKPKAEQAIGDMNRHASRL
jgi:hypothetical protein